MLCQCLAKVSLHASKKSKRDNWLPNKTCPGANTWIPTSLSLRWYLTPASQSSTKWGALSGMTMLWAMQKLGVSSMEVSFFKKKNQTVFWFVLQHLQCSIHGHTILSRHATKRLSELLTRWRQTCKLWYGTCIVHSDAIKTASRVTLSIGRWSTIEVQEGLAPACDWLNHCVHQWYGNVSSYSGALTKTNTTTWLRYAVTSMKQMQVCTLNDDLADGKIPMKDHNMMLAVKSQQCIYCQLPTWTRPIPSRNSLRDNSGLDCKESFLYKVLHIWHWSDSSLSYTTDSLIYLFHSQGFDLQTFFDTSWLCINHSRLFHTHTGTSCGHLDIFPNLFSKGSNIHSNGHS